MPLILENEPNVRFREVAAFFITDFPRPSAEPDYVDKIIAAEKGAALHLAQANGSGDTTTGITSTTTSTTTPITSTTTSTTGTTTSTTPATAANEAESKILAAVRLNPSITLKALAEELELTRGGVRYHTDNLQKRGILRRSGSYKGHWEIIGNDKTS
jgi:predicted HTH transcriptional regulator